MNLIHKFRDAASDRYYRTAAAFGTAMALSPFAAMAQDAGDATAIIDAQKTTALAVVVAGTVAILAIRYTKLARRA